jgi:hypothetical protein
MMKNVQMRINPELYAKFKLVDGESNNERMKKLLDDNHDKYRAVKLAHNLRIDNKKQERMVSYWCSSYLTELATNKTLASALVVSIAVSVCSVAYVCVVNGWFL